MLAVRDRKRRMVDAEVAFHLKKYKETGAELIMGSGRSPAASLEVARMMAAPERFAAKSSPSTPARERRLTIRRACLMPALSRTSRRWSWTNSPRI